MRLILNCSFRWFDIEKDSFNNLLQQLCNVTVLVSDYQIVTDSNQYGTIANTPGFITSFAVTVFSILILQLFSSSSDKMKNDLLNLLRKCIKTCYNLINNFSKRISYSLNKMYVPRLVIKYDLEQIVLENFWKYFFQGPAKFYWIHQNISTLRLIIYNQVAVNLLFRHS